MSLLSMIEVFKTNVKEESDAGNIVSQLRRIFPGSRINFDLHDCDKILRLEGPDFEMQEVIRLLNKQGFYCEVLE